MGNLISRERKICANNLKLFLEIEGFEYYICKKCRFIQTIQPKRNENVKDDYKEFELKNYKEFVKKFRVHQYQKDLELIKKYKKEGYLLDIACGTGEFLEVARENGFIPYGVEPFFCAWSIAKDKRELLNDEWEKINFREGYFDVITIWSVFEHMPESLYSLEKVKIALKKDGIVAMRLPVSSGLILKISILLFRLSLGLIKFPLKAVLQLDWYYPHLYIFNLKNLRIALEKTGFKMAKFKFENNIDIKSISNRVKNIKWNLINSGIIKLALWMILKLSDLVNKKDEIVFVGKRL